MISEIEEIPFRTRRSSHQLQIKQAQDQEEVPSNSNLLLCAAPQRSSSYDNIYDKQTPLTMENCSQQSTNNNQYTGNESRVAGDPQLYDGRNQIKGLIGNTQSVINHIDKMSVLLESQKLLRKLHKELENLVQRYKPLRKCEYEAKKSHHGAKGSSQYKDLKSRSRSKEKKKSSRNYSSKCYSPEQKMQGYQNSSFTNSANSGLKYKIRNSECTISNESNNRTSRFQYQRDNTSLNSSSDSNSPQLQENNDLEEDEKRLNIKLERINFKGDYSPPLRRGYGGYDIERRAQKNKLLFYLNKLDERSEEEEQDVNLDLLDKKAKHLYSWQDRDESFDSIKKKHEIEQLNEILKNLSIDIQNEYMKASQQQHSQQQQQSQQLQQQQLEQHIHLDTPANTNTVSNSTFKLNLQNLSSDQNIQNSQISSVSQTSFLPQQPPSSSPQTSSSTSLQSKYMFKSVEAGMDYVIRKLQNL